MFDIKKLWLTILGYLGIYTTVRIGNLQIELKLFTVINRSQLTIFIITTIIYWINAIPSRNIHKIKLTVFLRLTAAN